MINFIKIPATMLLCLYSFSAFATEWNYRFDPSHTSIDWKASHFGFSSPSGKFAQVEGLLYFNEKKVVRSKAEITIYVKNLLTGTKEFDENMKSKQFFNTEKFPIATFKTGKIKVRGKNSAEIYGDLTLMGITKTVKLNVKLNKIGFNPITKKESIGFSAYTKIKRSDFGMEYAIPAVSDEVELKIEAEAQKIN